MKKAVPMSKRKLDPKILTEREKRLKNALIYDLKDEFHGDYVLNKAKERIEILCKYNECKEINDRPGMEV